MSTIPTETNLDKLGVRLSAGSVVRTGEPLARHTTLRVGGPAELYVEPALESDLAETLRYCIETAQPFFLLGRGSNLLVRDGGVRGVVICLSRPHFSRVEVVDGGLQCGAGARLKRVAAKARQEGMAGFEFLEGIPGSMGGALRMNAGAMGWAAFDLVARVRIMEPSGDVVELDRSEMDVAYRSCASLKGRVVLSVLLRGEAGDPEKIASRMQEFEAKRKSSQPSAPSAGCMFKNPATVPAGRLIDELGLKGTCVGAARVSEKHGNFLVNDGGATAADVLGLIELIRDRARRERGIELETEVQIIGQ